MAAQRTRVARFHRSWPGAPAEDQLSTLCSILAAAIAGNTTKAHFTQVNAGEWVRSWLEKHRHDGELDELRKEETEIHGFVRVTVQRASAQPSLRGSEPPRSTPRSRSIQIACAPPIGQAGALSLKPRRSSS